MEAKACSLVELLHIQKKNPNIISFTSKSQKKTQLTKTKSGGEKKTLATFSHREHQGTDPT